MSWLNKWLYKTMSEGGKELAIEDQEYRVKMGNLPTPSSPLDRMFAECLPAMVAFKIDNGYVVRVIDTSNEVQLGGARMSGFHYCKDHAAIADHIVTESAKEKLGLTAGTMSGRYSGAVENVAQSSKVRSPR